VVALDWDASDIEEAGVLGEAAKSCFGPTDLVRVGRWPRHVGFFRRGRGVRYQSAEKKGPLFRTLKRSPAAALAQSPFVAGGVAYDPPTSSRRRHPDPAFLSDCGTTQCIGQAVDADVDMYGGRQLFRGRFSGFTMGTGSTLALLPGENATGNFVKVVERLAGAD
jgi:hypothetical protein